MTIPQKKVSEEILDEDLLEFPIIKEITADKESKIFDELKSRCPPTT